LDLPKWNLFILILIIALFCTACQPENFLEEGLQGDQRDQGDENADEAAEPEQEGGDGVSDLPVVTMDQFIGINAFIDDPIERIQVAGFVREYHNWAWCEGNGDPNYPGYPNNQNKFYRTNPGWNFDRYYQRLNSVGIMVFPCIQGGVDWLDLPKLKINYKPINKGANTQKPESYMAHADHMFQYAARYGSTVVADEKLKLAPSEPRLSGLGLIQYYEDWNEQNNWWDGPNANFDPWEYAAMASADYDGHLGTLGDTVGIKNADPNAKLVMGGLAGLNLEYIKAMKYWADTHRGGSFPADVLNFHHYCTDGKRGISPEKDGFKEKVMELVRYRDEVLPDKELWITEFGYDTHPDSPQTAGTELRQAQWLVRSFLILASTGIERAAMYMLRDVDPNDSTQYSTSGLVSSKETGWVPKMSWYFVYTLRNTLTNMVFDKEIESGNENVWIYHFVDVDGKRGAYALWCPTEEDLTVPGYSLRLPDGVTEAKLVTMEDKKINGNTEKLSLENQTVKVDVSETPIFVVYEK